MSDINYELWRVVASGGLNQLLAELNSMSDIDTRGRELDKRAVLGFLSWGWAKAGSLGFSVSKATMGRLWDEVQDSAYYAPEIRTQAVPMVESAASDGTTLTADAPPLNHTIYVYVWNGLTFAVLGDLASNATPAAGTYVLATHQDLGDGVSLPSLFLTVT